MDIVIASGKTRCQHYRQHTLALDRQDFLNHGSESQTQRAQFSQTSVTGRHTETLGH
jgi:hypothetical protein